MTGLAANGSAAGEYQNAYVHAKVALVDDVWATIGSTNIGNRSFYGDTELNASFWHRDTVRALRCELLLEHIAQDIEYEITQVWSPSLDVLVGTLGASAVAIIWCVFFPPARYRRWIQAADPAATVAEG